MPIKSADSGLGWRLLAAADNPQDFLTELSRRITKKHEYTIC